MSRRRELFLDNPSYYGLVAAYRRGLPCSRSRTAPLDSRGAAAMEVVAAQWHAKALLQSPNRLQRQGTPAAKHFVDSMATTNDGTRGEKLSSPLGIDLHQGRAIPNR